MRTAALDMPHVTVVQGPRSNAVYQVGGRSFVFFRTPRPDAVDPDPDSDPDPDERYSDVVVVWVGSESDKRALVQGPGTPSFTTSHFDGHPSVLVRASRIGELGREELREIVQDTWLAPASARRAASWLAARDAR